jgi:hypothetical protein
MSGFLNMLERILCEPDEQKGWTAARRQAEAVKQFTYRAKKGLFGREAALDAAKFMPAYAWWGMYGATTPELRIVAIRVLAQVWHMPLHLLSSKNAIHCRQLYLIDDQLVNMSALFQP